MYIFNLIRIQLKLFLKCVEYHGIIEKTLSSTSVPDLERHRKTTVFVSQLQNWIWLKIIVVIDDNIEIQIKVPLIKGQNGVPNLVKFDNNTLYLLDFVFTRISNSAMTCSKLGFNISHVFSQHVWATPTIFSRVTYK